jgi:hypothetical protein
MFEWTDFEMISSDLIIFAAGSRIAQNSHSLVEAVDAFPHKGFSPYQSPKTGLRPLPNRPRRSGGLTPLPRLGFNNRGSLLARELI